MLNNEKNIIKIMISKKDRENIPKSKGKNYAFYFYDNSDQNGAVSPVDNSTILNIPYQTGWNGQRYLLSTYNQTSQTYTPYKLQNLKQLSFTVDLSSSKFTSNDNCNFNCYFVSSTSAKNPNSDLAPINNKQYVSNANYYDAAAADGGRYGVEFDIFETNSGNGSNGINFYQNTGHFNSDLLDGTATSTGAQCITYSSSVDFNAEPRTTGDGAPDKNYRTLFENKDKKIDVVVNFSDPDTLDETTISFNGIVIWNSHWLIGGEWKDWSTASPSGNYPCSVIGTLTPFSNVTTDVSTQNSNLTWETINNANKAGLWLFFGMNPYYSPQTGSYNANHNGANGPNGSGGGINISDFTFTTW